MRALDQLQLEGHEDLKRELLMKILSRDDGDWELKVRKHGVDVGHTQPTHPGLCWTTWLRGVTWWGGTPALHEQGSVMMLINGVLNCEQLEESVTLRADFMFLSMMDVIRVCTAVANSTVCPRHRARFPTAAAWLGWGWVGFGVGVWRVFCVLEKMNMRGMCGVVACSPHRAPMINSCNALAPSHLPQLLPLVRGRLLPLLTTWTMALC